MTSLIKEKPKDPIQYLIDRLNKPEKKRIIIVTPPGMKGGNDSLDEEQYNVGLMLEQHLKEISGFENMSCISVGDLLMREITMHSDYGKRINACRKNYEYIPDEIVIELVQKHIAECEAEKDSGEDSQSGAHGWILEGFPRTRM